MPAQARVALVTDSTADMPLDLAAERGVHVAPMHVIWDGQDLRDRIDLDSAAFYARLAQSRTLPTTSPPSAQEFADIFQRARDASNAEAVLAFTISSQLSSSYHVAQQAARLVDFPVHAIDTRTGSIAHGLVVLAAADARDRGGGPEEVLRLALDAIMRTQMIFALDTLTYLHRSGRVSGLQRFIGGALQIKPILHVVAGGIALRERVRTRTRLLARLREIFDEVATRDRPLRIGVLHGAAADDLRAFVASLWAAWSPELLVEGTVGASVGIHTGPGSLGFAILQ
ncbi:MAG: DegV family protein [Anaerolineae bacterium]|nr:DegV family protein [Anaerolineae bacterium]